MRKRIEKDPELSADLRRFSDINDKKKALKPITYSEWLFWKRMKARYNAVGHFGTRFENTFTKRKEMK